MHPKTLKRLALVLAFLAAVLGIHGIMNRGAPGEPRLWPQAAQARKVAFGKLTLEREEPGKPWRLSSPFSFAADQKRVERFLEGLTKATLSAPLSSDVARHPRFAVHASSAVRLRGWSDGGEPSLDVLIGKSASTFNSVFVRMPESDAVREARGLARHHFDSRADTYADRTLAAIDQTRIVSLEIGGLKLRQDGGRWMHNGAPVDPARVKEKIEPMLTALSRMEADGIIDTASAHPSVLRGLARPELRIRVRHLVAGPEGSREELLELAVGPEKPGFDHPVRRSGVEALIYEVKPWRLEAFRLSAADLRAGS